MPFVPFLRPSQHDMFPRKEKKINKAMVYLAFPYRLKSQQRVKQEQPISSLGLLQVLGFWRCLWLAGTCRHTEYWNVMVKLVVNYFD